MRDHRPLITVIPRYGDDFNDADAARASWEAGETFALLTVYPMEHATPFEFVVSQDSFSEKCDICIKFDNRSQQVVFKNTKTTT